MSERRTFPTAGVDRPEAPATREPRGIHRLAEIYREHVQAIGRAWGIAMEILHTPFVADLDRPARREHRRRCKRCRNLPGYPKPLRADGADYHRRRKNRRKRR